MLRVICVLLKGSKGGVENRSFLFEMGCVGEKWVVYDGNGLAMSETVQKWVG
jgi:hypothetical protein